MTIEMFLAGWFGFAAVWFVLGAICLIVKMIRD